MHRFGTATLPLRQVDILENVDHLQSCEALAVGWQFAQFVAILVFRTGRLDPLAVMGGEIFAGEGTALSLEIVHHDIGERTIVIGVTPLAGDGLERIGKVGVAENLTSLGGGAVGEPDLARIGEIEFILASGVGLERPVEIHADDRGDGVAFAGIPYGRCKVIGHRTLAEPLVHGKPRINRARNGNRQGAIRRQGIGAVQFLLELVERLALGAAARTVDAVKHSALGIIDDREQIAAYAIARGFHQAERGIGGNRRIDRVAAILENVERDLRGKGMRGGRHAMLCDYRTARPVRADGTAASANLLFDRGLIRGDLRCGRAHGQGKGGSAGQ